ncbi:MAG: Asp-tRNA(Asn)/Glu-tRNA(Gln) amidotransferase subunit GatB [Patescibacteria group bacterium]|nr:Asp-tRNA(Asn)/Glu-tRNA(Gln) amidotransferase subunit GatB [Patescibacteria group bacterium]
MTTDYIATIGLEIHAELKTASKMFCSCKNDPDESRPNVNICPICLGHPGTLPVLNRSAIAHVLRIGTAVSGTLADFTEWDRKNYFYPDIPKGYQISQYAYPLVSGGSLAGVTIERIHLEEDTARSTHDSHAKSLVDFNRSGVPLLELVTDPVIHDAATAVGFARELQILLRYLGAGDANLEKGEMRIEANISVAPTVETEQKKFGTKTEVKNLNSFRSVERAIAYEVERQIDRLRRGERILQETRGFDESTGETYSQRSKESSHDYRYFPDPDIPKAKISEIPDFAADQLSKNIPELPAVRRERYLRDYRLTDKEVAVLIESPEIASYFESIISGYASDQKKVKLTVNYLLTDYLGLLKSQKQGFDSGSAIAASSFSELIGMIADGLISSRGAKELIPLLSREPTQSPRLLAQTHRLIQQSDESDLLPAIDKIVALNAKAVGEYKAGKTASLQFLIGQAMRATKGAGNPDVVRKLLLEKLS